MTFPTHGLPVIEQGQYLCILFNKLVATLLAGAIGPGVVFTNTDIALPEGDRGHARLKVLRFTQGEFVYMLRGERALLILVAIPFGFLEERGWSAFWFGFSLANASGSRCC